MKQTTSASRINYLDTARGIALLAIMVGHLYEEVHVYDTLVKALYTFHLPIFFIIAGYLFRYKEWNSFIRGKMRAYLIPYASFAIIMVISDAVFQSRRWKKVLCDDLLGFLVQSRFTTLWFLAALFVGVIIFWLICHLCKQDLRKILIWSMVIGTIGLCYDEFVRMPLPWNFDTAVVIQVYLGIGYYLKQKGTIEKLVGPGYKVWQKLVIAVALVAVGAELSIGNYLACHETLTMYWNCYGIFPLTIAASILISLAVIMLAAGLDRVTGDRAYLKPFTFLGANSMVYFAIHQSIGIAFATNLNRMWKLGGNLWAMFAIEFTVCLLADLLIRHTPLRFMLGKRKK